LKRRRAGAEERPALAVAPDEGPDAAAQAARLLKAAEADLQQREHTWRGVALLQGVLGRWAKTEAAGKARWAIDSRRMEKAEEKVSSWGSKEGISWVGVVRACALWRSTICAGYSRVGGSGKVVRKTFNHRGTQGRHRGNSHLIRYLGLLRDRGELCRVRAFFIYVQINEFDNPHSFSNSARGWGNPVFAFGRFWPLSLWTGQRGCRASPGCPHKNLG